MATPLQISIIYASASTPAADLRTRERCHMEHLFDCSEESLDGPLSFCQPQAFPQVCAPPCPQKHWPTPRFLPSHSWRVWLLCWVSASLGSFAGRCGVVICGMSMGERSQWAAGVWSSGQEVCSGLFLQGCERSWESIFSWTCWSTCQGCLLVPA